MTADTAVKVLNATYLKLFKERLATVEGEVSNVKHDKPELVNSLDFAHAAHYRSQRSTHSPRQLMEDYDGACLR